MSARSVPLGLVVIPSLTVASWNIEGIRGIGAARLEGQIAAIKKHHPDLVVLEEVGAFPDLADRLQSSLAGIGLDHFMFSASNSPVDKRYGNVLASRWSLGHRSWRERDTMRWPQLVIAAELEWSGSPVLVVGVHIPNGSENGWEKVYAFEAIGRGLSTFTMPTILAGDFNEPKEALSWPEILSWGSDRRGRLDGTFTDRSGCTHDRKRWQDAVEDVLTPRSCALGGWGSRHVISQAGRDLEPSHIVRGRFPRYFDHILTSGSLFRVSAVTYDHGVREGENRLSDHSIIVATLESTARRPSTEPAE